MGGGAGVAADGGTDTTGAGAVVGLGCGTLPWLMDPGLDGVSDTLGPVVGPARLNSCRPLVGVLLICGRVCCLGCDVIWCGWLAVYR